MKKYILKKISKSDLDNEFLTNKIHEDKEQINRQIKACSADTSPLEINKNNNSGKFIGSRGELYETTLLKCTCMDNSLRRKPCKHIYRLAHELNIIQLDKEVKYENIKIEYKDKKKNFDDYKKALDSLKGLTIEAQKKYLYILGRYNSPNNPNNPLMIYKNNSQAKELLAYNLIETVEYVNNEYIIGILSSLSFDDLLDLIADTYKPLYGVKRNKKKLVEIIMAEYPKAFEKALNDFILIKLPEILYSKRKAIIRELHKNNSELEFLESDFEYI